MRAFGLNAFRVYTVLLGVWTGSGVHDTLSSHFAWWADPVAWYARPAWDGLANPWPFTTMALLLATLVAGVVAFRWRGPGRKAALFSLGGTALILVATLAWFVPELGLMGSGQLDAAGLISHGRTWIVLNAVRLVLLVAVLWSALLALGRFGEGTRLAGA